MSSKSPTWRVTGLPNRTLFRERMSEALARCRRGSPFAKARPYDIGAHRVDVGVSIGIATDALGATTEIMLLKDADGA